MNGCLLSRQVAPWFLLEPGKGPVGSPCGLVGCSYLQCWSLGCNLFLLVFSDSFRCLCKKSIAVLIVLFIMSQDTEAFLNENSADL